MGLQINVYASFGVLVLKIFTRLRYAQGFVTQARAGSTEVDLSSEKGLKCFLSGLPITGCECIGLQRIQGPEDFLDVAANL